MICIVWPVIIIITHNSVTNQRADIPPIAYERSYQVYTDGKYSLPNNHHKVSQRQFMRHLLNWVRYVLHITYIYV